MKKNISETHFGVLSKDAQKLLPKLRQFVSRGILGGGTAIALQLGHRRSYDLDIFTLNKIPKTLLSKAREVFGSVMPIIDNRDELTLKVGGTKISVICYPFKSLYKSVHTTAFPLLDLQDLASSKAYTIGRRGAWRDYADMFVLLKHGLSLDHIIGDAGKRFGENFNGKLFLEQLTYFEDIEDFSIEWIGKNYDTTAVKQYLQKEVEEYLAVHL